MPEHPAAKAIVPAILAAITLLVAFGAPITETQQDALTGFVLALVPVIVYYVPNQPRR